MGFDSSMSMTAKKCEEYLAELGAEAAAAVAAASNMLSLENSIVSATQVESSPLAKKKKRSKRKASPSATMMKIKCPELLLAYSYKLYDKELYYGYTLAKNGGGLIESAFCLISEKRSSPPIVMTSREFSEFINSPFISFHLKNQAEIQQPHLTLPKRVVLSSNSNISLKVSSKNQEQVLIVESENNSDIKNSKLTFNIRDLEKLITLRPSITTHGCLMELNRDQVNAFFKQYIETCRQMSTSHLLMASYQCPPNPSPHINFFQLHVEIGAFLADDVFDMCDDNAKGEAEKQRQLQQQGQTNDKIYTIASAASVEDSNVVYFNNNQHEIVTLTPLNNNNNNNDQNNNDINNNGFSALKHCV